MINRKNIVIFIVIITILSIISGIIYGMNNRIDISNISIILNNNTLILNNVIIFVFFLLTLSIFGIIVYPIYFSLEGISIGYISYLFIYTYHIKGLLFYILYLILSKLVNLILISYLFYISYKYIDRIIKNIKREEKDYIFNIVYPLIKKFIIIFVISIINSLITYFVFNDVIKYLFNSFI